MTDDEFVEAFERGEVPAHAFRHRDHLRLAWILVRRDGLDAGGDRAARGIRGFAARHGVPDRYHETITWFWLRLVAHAIAAEPDVGRFEAFLGRFPLLLDGSLVGRHWLRETLASPAARVGWVEPDRAPVP